MQGIFKVLRLAMLAGCLMLAAGRARAEHPTYLILPASPSIGYAIPADRPRYAYGWFGATQIRPHWTRHFGYYRDQIRWTAR